MNVDITIYGYITSDGSTLCPGCTSDEEKASDKTDRLFSWQLSEWSDSGFYCDGCGAAVVEAEHGCPAGLCEEDEEDHEDIIGLRDACPGDPRSWVRVTESVDGKPFNVGTYEIEVAGEDEDEVYRNVAAHLAGKVATFSIVEVQS